MNSHAVGEPRVEPAPASTPGRKVPHEFTLLVALAVAQALPVWLFQFFPSQDGASHLANADALLRYGTSPVLQEYYSINRSLSPNWSGHLVAAALLLAFSPALVEKLILTGYLLALPLAFRGALPKWARAHGLAFLVFPFVQAFHFQMGFWNFSWSVVLFFVTVRFWWHRGKRLTFKRGLVLSLLFILLYFTHPLSLVLALTSFGTSLAVTSVLALTRVANKRRTPNHVVRAVASRALVWLVCALPAMSLLIFYSLGSPPAGARLSAASLVARLFVLRGLVALDPKQGIGWEQVVSAIVALSIILASLWIAIHRGPHFFRLQRRDAWLVVSIAFAVLFFAIPEASAGGFHVSDRISVYVYLALLLWLVDQKCQLRLVQKISVLSLAASVALVGCRLPRFAEMQPYMSEFVSVSSQLRQDSVLLPLIFRPEGPAGGYSRVNPYSHAGGYVALLRGAVDLTNYEASTAYFPLKFHPDRNPYLHLGRIEDNPPCADLDAAGFAGTIDYVYVWAAQDMMAGCGKRLHDQLRQRFDLIFVSTPRGLGRLYQRKATEG